MTQKEEGVLGKGMEEGKRNKAETMIRRKKRGQGETRKRDPRLRSENMGENEQGCEVGIRGSFFVWWCGACPSSVQGTGTCMPVKGRVLCTFARCLQA